ncbi:MFS family transporter [Pseudomonas aeruginosa PA38182]|nr:MFS family transporter [Pseudomonas aeruginosa PA38182]
MTAEALARPLGEPTRRDWIAVLSAMLGAFMAVLDIQITNSSLKDIQARWRRPSRKARGSPPPTWWRRSS